MRAKSLKCAGCCLQILSEETDRVAVFFFRRFPTSEVVLDVRGEDGIK